MFWSKEFPLEIGDQQILTSESEIRTNRQPKWVPKEPETKGWITIDEFDIDDISYSGTIPSINDIDAKENHTETLAWYSDYHSNSYSWGIYVREYGIHRHAKHIEEVLWKKYGIKEGAGDKFPDFSQAPPHEIPEQTFTTVVRSLALQRLVTHEWFHFQVEYLSYLLEDSLEKSLYPEYKKEVYDQTWPDEDCIEESLANACVARSQKCSTELRKITDGGAGARPKLDWELLVDQTTVAPPAYEQFERFLGNQDFEKGCQKLCQLILKPNKDSQTQTQGKVQNGILGSRIPFDYVDAFDKWRKDVPLHILPLSEDSML